LLNDHKEGFETGMQKL